MKVLTGTGPSYLCFREEAISAREVAQLTKDRRLGREPGGWIWAIFFVVRKAASGDLVRRIEYESEMITREAPISETVTRGRYTSIIVSFSDDTFPSSKISEQEEKLWMAAMRVARDFELHGATLFSPRKFVEYDPTAFGSLVGGFWEIDPEEYLRQLKNKRR